MPPLLLVALRKESVDRKLYLSSFVLASLLSLSARRAWIENEFPQLYKAMSHVSLSARRAWIENINNNYNDLTRPVALRKESVDRKITRNIKVSQEQCRSPQGERG